MEAINIRAFTSDSSQIEALKAVMKALKINFELSTEKPYNSEFVEMVLESEQEIKQGKGLKVSSREFDDLWK